MPRKVPKWDRPLLFSLVPADHWDYVSPLTDAERADLDAIAAGTYRKGRFPRLSTPLWSLFEAMRRDTSWNHNFWFVTIRQVALEVRHLGLMPGCWNDDHWKAFLARMDSTNSFGFMLVAYLVGGLPVREAYGPSEKGRLSIMATRIFGPAYTELQSRVIDAVSRLGYSTKGDTVTEYRHGFADFVLRQRSLEMTAGSLSVMQSMVEDTVAGEARTSILGLWRALHALGFLPDAPPRFRTRTYELEDRSSPWDQDVTTWLRRQTRLLDSTARRASAVMRAFGKWFAVHEPRVTRIRDLDVIACEKFVAAVATGRVGTFGVVTDRRAHRPLAGNSKRTMYSTMRVMVRDYVRMGLAPKRTRYLLDELQTPRHVSQSVSHDEPRDIDDLVYAKMLGALESLTQEDVGFIYPLALVKAAGAMLMFSGLRDDEMRRLDMHCFANRDTGDEQVVVLKVPVHKTGPAFEKPVAVEIYRAVQAWLDERPDLQVPLEDRRTQLLVPLLFQYRGQRLGRQYFNRTFLPMLCRKAGIPQRDDKARITAHRCRSTMATLLANAPEPMSLLALKEWLGHRSASSTVRYARVKLHSMVRGYGRARAGVEVLVGGFVDLIGMVDPVSEEARSRNIIYTDLGDGNGVCSQEGVMSCPHLMDCPGCEHHVAEAEPLVRRLRRRENARAILQQFTLSEVEARDLRKRQKAAKGAFADVPTPDGRTPRQIAARLIEETG